MHSGSSAWSSLGATTFWGALGVPIGQGTVVLGDEHEKPEGTASAKVLRYGWAPSTGTWSWTTGNTAWLQFYSNCRGWALGWGCKQGC